MIRLLLLLFVLQFCSLQNSFGQNPAPKPEKQEPLLDSITKYKSIRQFAKAYTFAQQLVEMAKTQSGEQSLFYAKALGLTGEIQLRQRKIEEAQQLFSQSLGIYNQLLPEGNLDVAFVNHHFGTMLLNTQQNPERAEAYLLKAEEIKSRNLPEMHPDNIVTWRQLASLYLNISQFEKAETYFKKSLKANQKHFSTDPKKVPDAYTDLSTMYAIWGNFPKAEAACFTAIQLYEKNLKEDEIPSGPFNTLGHVYDGLGNYPKAEQSFLRAYQIIQKTMPPNHPTQFKILTSLGGHFVLSGQYQQAVFWLEKAIQAREKLPQGKEEQNAFEEGNLMIAYQELGLFSKAERMGKIVVETREKLFGPNHYNTANAYSSMADLHLKTNRLAEAKVYLNKMGNAYEKSFGSRLPNFETQFNKGTFDWSAGELGAAKITLTKSMETMKTDVARYFPALSDHEKAQYYEQQVMPKVNFFTSFSMQQAGRFPELIGEEYNLTLATKALLLSTSARWKQRIKTSGDKKLFALYTEWEVLQNRLANWHSSEESGNRKQFDSTLAISEKLEKELSARSESFGKMADNKPVTWKQIQAKLKPGEVAVEMIRFRKLGIEKTVTDTSDPKKPNYRIKGLSDTIYYAALLVKAGQAPPEMVLLKNGDDLEGKYLKFYQNSVSRQLADTVSYRQFWEKIGKKLGNSNRVYFSPDGVFHLINLNTLYNPKSKKFLLEEKDIRTVTVTKDIVNPGSAEEENTLVQLVGFPSYYLSAPSSTIVTTERKSPEMSYLLRLESVGMLAELPGTKIEVDRISTIFESKGWDVKHYTEENALEENLKESYKPRVLHIATHGFFQADTTKGSNPLLRSGLMLAGAGSTLKGEKNETGEDGILTAYEAMNLNLDNTDLVVLSACETGLGEVKNGEGVYGLQRAFKVAGARSIIMSLWKVDDEATQELMVSFYKHWLENRTDSSKLSVGSKRDAFLKAQKELKAKYPNPYYWGAFVMVGE